MLKIDVKISINQSNFNTFSQNTYYFNSFISICHLVYVGNVFYVLNYGS